MKILAASPQVELSRSSINQSVEDDGTDNVEIVLALLTMPTNFLHLELQPHELDVVSHEQGQQVVNDNQVQAQQVQPHELDE
jgi:hypothetical protein